MAGFKVVIPARYGSTRLPGKPLRDIAGKPMIQHVCERAPKAHAGQVVVRDHEAHALSPEERQGLLGRLHAVGRKACQRDDIGHHPPDDLLVVHDQDRLSGLGHLAPGRLPPRSCPGLRLLLQATPKARSFGEGSAPRRQG